MEEKNVKIDVLKLGNELTTRRYLFNKLQVGKVLNTAEYIAMKIIMETEGAEDIYEGKTYLTDISKKMQLSIRQTSRMIGVLKDRGLINWSHDGDGSEGTYVTITGEGRKQFKQQEEVTKEYYGKVVDKFGAENLVQLLKLMKQLETVMGSELEGMEVPDEESVE